jgi:hypothetical protein
MNIKHMPFGKFEFRLIFWREKRHCPNCNKARSEALDFLAPETPHLSKDYSWWLGRLVEIVTVLSSDNYFYPPATVIITHSKIAQVL